MPTKPSDLPNWATDAGTTVEPTSGKQAAGWTVAEKPPAKYFNWWMNLVYQWVVFVNALFTSDGRLLHGSRIRRVPFIFTYNGSSAWGYGLDGYAESTASGECQVQLELDEGIRITSISVWVYGDGAADLTWKLWSVRDALGFDTAFETVTVTNPAASFAESVMTVSPEVTTAGDRQYVLTFDANAANIRVRNITITYDELT